MPTPAENLRTLRNCPLAIICGKPEEAARIADALGTKDTITGASVEGLRDDFAFYLGKLEVSVSATETKTIDYYVTSSPRQGLLNFGINATILLQHLKPQYVLHTGTCAGYAGEAGMEIGTVVFGDTALSYEEGKHKWDEEKKAYVFFPEFLTNNLTLSQMTGFVQKNNKWKKGDYISGLAVREDAKGFIENIRATVSRNTLALEMEASAFMRICQSFGDKVHHLGIVKGVSDLGNKDKTKVAGQHEEVLQKTAAAVKLWLQHYFKNVDVVLSEDQESGARAARAYHDSFIDSVVNEEQRSAEEPRPLKIVMPPPEDPGKFVRPADVNQLVRHFKLKQIEIGQRANRRTGYERGGTLIDFVQLTPEVLAGDPKYQASLYERVLREQGQCKTRSDGLGLAPNAEVLTWDKFVELMQRMPAPAAGDPNAGMVRGADVAAVNNA